MKLKFSVLIILLTLIFSVFPGAAFSETKQLESYTYKVLKASPNNFAFNNGTVLFNGIINAYSDAGRKFAFKHKDIAEEVVSEVDSLGYKLAITRTLNKEYNDQIIKQYSQWLEFTNKNPEFKTILGRETQLFNINLSYMVQENIRWAVIESIKEEIAKHNKNNSIEVSMSIIKSDLYNSLLLSYIDLIDFYNDKYKYLFTISTLNHAVEENPELKVPEGFLAELKPEHEVELKTIKKLLYDMGDNFEKVNEISLQAEKFQELNHEIDKYSVSELEKIIANLKSQRKKVKISKKDELIKPAVEMIDSYIEFYEALKEEMENKILAYEMKKAVKESLVNENKVYMAYTGMFNSELIPSGYLSEFASSAYNVVRTGVGLPVNAAYAAVDYSTRTYYDKLFEFTDKAEAAWNMGLFSEQYNNYAQAYNEAGAAIPTATIRNTFVEPLQASLSGDFEHGLGQHAARIANESYEEFEGNINQVTGSKFVANIALNVVTAGGYGVGKDFNTLNNAEASAGDKAAAAVGIALNIVPVIGAGSATRAAAGGVKSTATNAASRVGTAIAEVEEASAVASIRGTALENARNRLSTVGRQLANWFDDNPSREVTESLFNQLDEAVENVNVARQALNEARENLSETVAQNISRVAWETHDEAIEAGGNALSRYVQEHGAEAIRERFVGNLTNDLRTTIAETGRVNYAIESAIDNSLQDLTAQVANAAVTELTGTSGSIIKKPPVKPFEPIMETDPAVTVAPVDINLLQGGSSQGQSQVVDFDPGNMNDPNIPLIEVDPTSMGISDDDDYPHITPPPPPPDVEINIEAMDEYLSSRNDRSGKPVKPGEFESTIRSVQQITEAHDQNRGLNNVPGFIGPQPQTFSTDPTVGPDGSRVPDIRTRVQNVAALTSGGHNSGNNTNNNNNNQQNSGGTSTGNIPGYDGNTESAYDGIDNDGDGLIDEGFANGTCQIIIHDTGGDKDDQWALKVDGQDKGYNVAGKTRNWDLNLSKGNHNVSFTGVNIPDKAGTYTVVFQRASLVSGPPLTGRKLNQGVTYTWVINVP